MTEAQREKFNKLYPNHLLYQKKTMWEKIKEFTFSGEDYKPTTRDVMYFIALVLLIALTMINL